jgi:hypothetical protein
MNMMSPQAPNEGRGDIQRVQGADGGPRARSRARSTDRGLDKGPDIKKCIEVIIYYYCSISNNILL